MRSNNPVYAGLDYLPGDVMVAADGKKFRIVSTSRFESGSGVWGDIADAFEQERVALSYLRHAHGRSGMDRLLNKLGGQRPPKVLLKGKDFGSGGLRVENSLARLLVRILPTRTPSRFKDEWDISDDCVSLSDVFSALRELDAHDPQYVRRIWNKLWTKADASPWCAEALTYHRLTSSGLSVSAVEEGQGDSPDFEVSTSSGPLFLERKAIQTNATGEYDDVIKLLHQLVVRAVEQGALPMAVGFKGSALPVKRNLARYTHEIELMRMGLAQAEVAEPLVASVDGVDIVGLRIPRDTTSNLPSGYGMKLEIPLAKYGFDLSRTLYQAGFMSLPSLHLDVAFATCFDFPDSSWVGPAIEKALSKAQRQVKARGHGVIQISFPYHGVDRPDIENRIGTAMDRVRLWWIHSRAPEVEALLISFMAVEFLRDLKEPDCIEGIRFIERNERLLSPDSMLSKLRAEEVAAWARAFPSIRVRILAFATPAPQHLKRAVVAPPRASS